jgi:signal transduction histidine kinase
LDNALKFTKEGSIDISVDYHSYLAEERKHRLLFAVKDTGVGIPLERQNVIFDYFTQGDSSTTKLYKGLGLGLSVASKLIKRMGGDIWFESSESGSIFFFTFYVNEIKE